MTLTVPLKRLVERNRPITYGIVQAGEDVEGGVPYIRPVDMDGHRGVDPMSLRTTSPEIAAAYARSAVQPGDVVVSIGPSFGKIMVVPQELDGANLTQGTARVALRSDVSSRFVVWSLQSQHAIDYWETSIGGATFRALNLGPLANTPIRLPSLIEQVAIADYLDRETSRIDTLIEEQRRLIEMLRERRQAVIDHEIRDGAGVPLISLRGLVLEPIAAGADETSDPSNPAGWPRFVRTTDIMSLTQLDPDKRVTADPGATGDAMLARNDLVATRAGATIGKAYIHLSDEPASYAGYLVRIRPDPTRVVPMFLGYWSQSRHYTDQIAVGAVKSTIENYSASKYRATRVPVPPLDEQQRVVSRLDDRIAKIDKLIAETEHFIELSRERRAALITAAVTGQIDVREVA